MSTDMNGTNPPASGPQAGAPGPAMPLPDGAADAAGAIGYEAADPALQAPLWAEAMKAAAPSGNLR